MNRREFLGLTATAFVGVRPALAAPQRRPGALLAVVTAQDSPVAEIGLGDLKKLYLGEPTSVHGGVRLVAFNHPPGTLERITFDRALLGMEPDDIGAFWVDQRIRGHGRPPRFFEATQLQRLIPRMPGAISYMRLEAVTPALKVLPVDGKRPVERGYRLMG